MDVEILSTNPSKLHIVNFGDQQIITTTSTKGAQGPALSELPEELTQLGESQLAIDIALAACSEATKILEKGGALTKLGNVSPLSYDEIYTRLPKLIQQRLDSDGVLPISVAHLGTVDIEDSKRPGFYRKDNLGIDVPGQGDPLPNELIFIVSPNLRNQLAVSGHEITYNTLGAGRYAELKHPWNIHEPHSGEQTWHSLNTGFIQALSNLISGNLQMHITYRSNIGKEVAHPRISPTTLAKATILEAINTPA